MLLGSRTSLPDQFPVSPFYVHDAVLQAEVKQSAFAHECGHCLARTLILDPRTRVRNGL